MTKIKVACRQLIDSKSTSDFEKKLFNDSFNEFYLQSQAYSEGGRLKTFQDLIEHNPKAHSLHYKVGFSVGRYVEELKNVIPGLQDSIGKPLAFENHEFQLLASDISNKNFHKIAIIYTSPWLDLLAIAGNYLIVGKSRGDSISTLTIQLRENISIVEWDQAKSEKTDLEIYENKKQLG
jgi:hypothetical protein